MGQEQEQVKQEDSEMIDLTNVESDVGMPPRLDKGKGRVTPAITLQPPTPTPPHTTEVQSDHGCPGEDFS